MSVNGATYYLLATYIPTYFNQMLGLSSVMSSMVSLSILLLSTVLLPIFGKYGENRSSKKIFLNCTFGIIILLVFLYIAISNRNILWIGILGTIFILPIACMTALLPHLLTQLFPAHVRFTGVSLSFNLADGIIGGFTSAAALILLIYTKDQGAFCFYLIVMALISLFCYSKIKE